MQSVRAEYTKAGVTKLVTLLEAIEHGNKLYIVFYYETGEIGYDEAQYFTLTKPRTLPNVLG